MTINRFATIDPGGGGGIALYKIGQASPASAFKMPDLKVFESFIIEQRDIAIKKGGELVVMIEHQQNFASDQQDGKWLGMQKLLKNYNQLCGNLETNHIKWFPIMPRYWQKDLGLGRLKDESKSQRKNRYKAKAAEWYPYVKGTLWTADALCMLRFFEKKLRFDKQWIENKFK